jgi:uncharacterized membrane protein YdbT with pleckstrin-like domain
MGPILGTMAAMNPYSLLDGEKVVYEGKLHWIVFLKPAIISFILFGAVISIIHQVQRDVVRISLSVSLVALFFALLMAAPALLKYWSSWIVITNKRVIARMGLLSRRSFDMLLVKIEGISVDQNLLGRMLDYGTIIVRGIGGGKEYFADFKAPAEISKQVHQQIANEILPVT